MPTRKKRMHKYIELGRFKTQKNFPTQDLQNNIVHKKKWGTQLHRVGKVWNTENFITQWSQNVKKRSTFLVTSANSNSEWQALHSELY
jgi:hypothetical protein